MNTKVTDGLKFQRHYPTGKECCFHPNTDFTFLFFLHNVLNVSIL